MTSFDRVGERYQNDATFHAAVDMLQSLILDLQLSPSEIREAAMFACYRVEMRRPVPVIPYSGDPYRSPPSTDETERKR
jgi:hypothetical protein